ncbi:MAG: LPXTG cell wall anchor domain-containing protein [Eubacterium sp.]|nr:LPXTG cell wall anchor domain-containing protein [Eubacterium sp.]
MFKKALVGLIGMVMVAITTPGVAMADPLATHTLPDVFVTDTGDIPEGTKHTITVSADEDVPLPKETSISVDPNSKGTFGNIEYDIPGEYQYHITDIEGSKDYEVTVTVTNGEDGYSSVQVAKLNNDKVAKIAFDYSFPEKEVTVPKTGTDTVTIDAPAETNSNAIRIPHTGDDIAFVATIGIGAVVVLLAGASFVVLGKKKKVVKK